MRTGVATIVAFSPDQKNELKTGLVDVQAGKGRGG